MSIARTTATVALSVLGMMAAHGPAAAQDDGFYNPGSMLPDPMAGMDRGEEYWEDEDLGDEYPPSTGCGYETADLLAQRIQRLLSANGQCELYAPSRYEAFKQEVPQGQLYAVNYVAWVAGGDLIPADQAAALDAQYLGDALLTPFGPEATQNPPSSTQLAAAPSADAPSPERGACGFPVVTPEQASGQDILAKMGRCDEYQGARQ